MEKKSLLFNIKEGHMTALVGNRIPLEAVYVLELLHEKKDAPEYMGKAIQWCQRKAYIDMKGQLTEYGKKLYESLLGDVIEELKTKGKVIKNDDFEKWWDAFPSSDHFSINGRDFIGTRNMKTQKEKCKELFNVMVHEGILAEDIIRATKWVVEKAKEKSLRVGQNQVSYIPATERFLRERKFSPFIEISKNKKQEVKDFEI